MAKGSWIPVCWRLGAAFLFLAVVAAPGASADDGEWEWKFYKGEGWSRVSVWNDWDDSEEVRGLVFVCVTDTPPAYIFRAGYPVHMYRTSRFVRIFDPSALHWMRMLKGETEITPGLAIKNLAEIRVGKREPQRVGATLVAELVTPYLLWEDEETLGDVEALELAADIVADALRREDDLVAQIGAAPAFTIPTEGAAAVMSQLDAVCPAATGEGRAEADTSAAVIEEAPPPQIIEVWSCFEQWGDRSTTLFALTRYEGRKGRVDVAGASHEAVFSVAGLNRRWEWGELTAEGAYRYAVVLEPNSRAAYTDFTFAEKGNAEPSRYYSCERSRY